MKMKKKIISILSVLFITLSLICVSNVYAATACKMHIHFEPTNPNAGDEFEVVVSFTEINDEIAKVDFTLNYDETLFDFVSAVGGSQWNTQRTGHLITVLTKNNTPTTTTGDVVTIKLKAKDTITTNTDTTVSLTSIEVTTADNTKLTLSSQEQDVTIEPKQQTTGNEGTNTVNETTNNETTGTNTVNETTNNETTGTNTVNETTNTETVGTNTVNETTNKVDNTTTKDSKLPQTGVNSVTIIVSILSISIIGIVSYMLYRKN